MSGAVLEAREDRWRRRMALAGSLPGGWAVLSFTLRAPAPLRTGGAMDREAEGLFRDLVFHMGISGFHVARPVFAVSADGPEGLCTVKGAGPAVKLAAVKFEEEHPRGEMADVDVMESGGEEADRAGLGLPPRECLVCRRRAAECAAARSHEIGEIGDVIKKILSRPEGFPGERPVMVIAERARRAVLYEAAAWPKPGLVDPVSRGAHTDMDFFTFLDGAAGLAPVWERFARLGARFGGDSPADLFPSLREEGKKAEKLMFSATGGVNTHKGLVFSLGVMCASAGMLASAGIPVSPGACAARGADIVRGVAERDFAPLKSKKGMAGPGLTSGERFFLSEGVTGIRGEAERGFPSVIQKGLPALRASLERGGTLNDSMVDGLLSLMTVVEDTNILSRGGREGERLVREAAAGALELGGAGSPKGREAVERMDGLFLKKNLSPGGCADLLAVSVFLHLLTPASG